MSGLNILGGIGQGLQQGVGFMQQKKLQDEQVRQSQARLSMLEEEQNWKRQQREAEKAEQERLSQYNNEYRTLAGEMEMGTPDFYRELSKRTFKFAKPDELEALDKKLKDLEGSELGDALLYGDTDKASSVFTRKFGEPVQIVQQAGKDAFGNPQPVWSAVGQSGRQYFSMPAAELGALHGRKEMLDIAKSRREDAKALGEVSRDKAAASASYASAGAANALARQRNLESEGLAAIPAKDRASRASGGKGDSPLSTMGKEAADMVRMGLADDEGSALKMLRADKSLSQAVQIVMNNPVSISKSESELASAVRKTAQLLRAQQGAADEGGGDDPLGLFQ